MSKIFEALKRTEGDLAEMTLPLVTQDQPEGSGPLVPVATATADEISAVLQESGSSVMVETFTEAPAAPTGRTHQNGFRPVSIRVAVDAPILPFEGLHSRAGEEYRMARTKIIHDPRQPRLIVISSAAPGDGKTVSSINLAGALALKSDAQVALVDADMRRSSVAALLGISESPGLSDVLNGTAELKDAMVRLDQIPNLCILPGNKGLGNPTEVLESARWTALCETLRQQFEYVIFDAPPIGAVADYDLIQAACDGVVLVVRPDHTNRTLFQQAVDSVPKEKLIGVLMNCVRDW